MGQKKKKHKKLTKSLLLRVHHTPFDLVQIQKDDYLLPPTPPVCRCRVNRHFTYVRGGGKKSLSLNIDSVAALFLLVGAARSAGEPCLSCDNVGTYIPRVWRPIYLSM